MVCTHLIKQISNGHLNRTNIFGQIHLLINLLYMEMSITAQLEIYMPDTQIKKY